MNRKFAALITGILIVICFAGPPAESSSTDNIYSQTNTRKVTFPNGMTLILHSLRKTPIAEVDIFIKTGGATEGRFSGSGISHLAEHMLFKGVGDFCSRQIRELGGYINGYTSHEYTVFSVTVPSTKVTEALDIMKRFVMRKSIETEEFAKEKEVILDEIRKSLDDPVKSVLEAAWRITYLKHPYKYPILGHPDLFLKLTAADLNEYYRKHYTPGNMVLSMAGDFDMEGMLAAASERFSDIKMDFLHTPSAPEEPNQVTERRYEEQRDISLVHSVVCAKSVGIDSPDLYALDVLSLILGHGDSSILTSEMKNKRKLVYDISSGNYTLQEGGLFYVYFTCEKASRKSALEALSELTDDIKKNGVSKHDLEKAKKMARAGFLYALETVRGRARDLATSEILTGDHLFSEKYVKRIEEVTARDVMEAASKYLMPMRINTSSLIPSNGNDETAETPNEESSHRQLSSFKLDNGMRLLIAEDESNPLCTITALFLGGARSETPQNNGISNIVSRLLLGGTKRMSEEDIKSQIESLGGAIENISGNNTFGVSIKVLSEDAEKGIEILGDLIKESQFKQESIDKEKTLALAAVKKRDDNIIRYGIVQMKKGLFGGHPYSLHHLGTDTSINSIDRASILEYYRKYCVPENMVVSVSGGVAKEDIFNAVQSDLNNFGRNGLPGISPPAPEFPRKDKEIDLSMQRRQSIVIIGFPSATVKDDDRYTLELLDSLLSGINGRLFTNIRERLGMTYTIGSSFVPGLEPGYFIFYALTSADNIGTVKEALRNEIKILKSEPVTEEELKAAKSELLTAELLNLQRNENFGMRMALDEIYGLGYDHYRGLEEKITEITSKEILKKANLYFSTEKSIAVVIKGEVKMVP